MRYSNSYHHNERDSRTAAHLTDTVVIVEEEPLLDALTSFMLQTAGLRVEAMLGSHC